MRTHRAGVRTAEARRGGCAVGKHSSSHITPHAGRIPHRPPAAAAVRPRSKPAHRSFTSDHMTLQDRSQSLLDEHAPRASVLSQATCRFTLAARLGGLDPILHSANVVSCIAQSLRKVRVPWRREEKDTHYTGFDAPTMAGTVGE